MTRILVFSDIHGAVPAVEALTETERSNFDAVVIAGDIGPRPTAFFRALEPLGCPVFYVYGNWDGHLSYDYVFNKRFVHLHGVIASVGPLQLAGFSGCCSQWGQNPQWRALLDDVEHEHRPVMERLKAAQAANSVVRSGTDSRADRVRKTRGFGKYAAAWRTAWQEASARNRVEVVERLDKSECDPKHFVFVSHEWLYRLPEDVPGLGAHLFGHRHGFKVSKQRGTTFVNVSALDPWATRGAQYGVIEWTALSGFKVLERNLPRTQGLRLQCLEYKSTATAVVCEPDGLTLPIARSPF